MGDSELPIKRREKKPLGAFELLNALAGIRRKTQKLAEEVGINGLPDRPGLELGVKAETKKIHNNLEIIETAGPPGASGWDNPGQESNQS